MKRMLLVCLAVALFCVLPARAEDNPLWCGPEEVDVSSVLEENGRLVGEIGIPQGEKDPYVLRIDCPLPKTFTEKQQAKLHVSYRDIGTKDLQNAMKTIGQTADADQMQGYKDGWANRWLRYSAKKTEEGYSFFQPYLMPGWQNPDAAPAMEKLTALAGQLDISLDLGTMVAARNRAEDCLAYCSASQNSSGWYQEIYQSYGKMQGDVFLLNARYRLYGMPVQPQFSWKAGNDGYAASSHMECAVGADGTLLEAEISGVPVVENTEPIALPKRSWQEIVKLCVSQGYWPNSTARDIQVENDPLYGSYTVYAAYDTITAIEPCWIGREKQRLEPGWSFRGVSRVMKDNSVCGWFEWEIPAIP